jgi:hypothetical protein
MSRRIALEISILVIGAALILPAYAYIYSQSIQQISQTIINVYDGVETVQVTGSIPNGMDTDQFGFYGAVFWNPTSQSYRITHVEFRAKDASTQVLREIEQGKEQSYPTTGWSIDGKENVVSLKTDLNVSPHTSQQFFIRIQGNGQMEAFEVTISITANNEVFQKSYKTQQTEKDSALPVLWLGSETIPQFIVYAVKGEDTVFYVSLQEDANKVPIGSEGVLAIQLAPEFTNIKDVGGDGWASAVISDSTIEVANKWEVLESTITYGFIAHAPEYKGLYMFSAFFKGANDELPLGEFCVIVTDEGARLG